jgi:hypothetical protein
MNLYHFLIYNKLLLTYEQILSIFKARTRVYMCPPHVVASLQHHFMMLKNVRSGTTSANNNRIIAMAG